MNELIQSLIAAGIATDVATRIARAVMSAAAQPGGTLTATATAASGWRPVDGDGGGFAARLKAPGSTIRDSGSSFEVGGGGGALHAEGAVVVSGPAYFAGPLIASGITNRGDLVNRGAIQADAVAAGEAELGPVSVARTGVDLAAPLRAGEGLVSSGKALFSGANMFDGPVKLSGGVDWQGARQPADVRVLAAVVGDNPNDEVLFHTRKVAVLNDRGAGAPAKLKARLVAETTAVTAEVTFSATTSKPTAAATLHAATSEITYVSAVACDQDGNIVVNTASVAVVTGGTVEVEVYPADVMTSFTVGVTVRPAAAGSWGQSGVVLGGATVALSVS